MQWDSVAIHTATMVQDYIREKGIKAIPHLPNLLELAPTGYFLFPKMNSALADYSLSQDSLKMTWGGVTRTTDLVSILTAKPSILQVLLFHKILWQTYLSATFILTTFLSLVWFSSILTLHICFLTHYGTYIYMYILQALLDILLKYFSFSLCITGKHWYACAIGSFVYFFHVCMCIQSFGYSLKVRFHIVDGTSTYLPTYDRRIQVGTVR